MRTWIWVLSALLPPISADVLCDVRMSERTVMLINTKTGDEKYTAATLELECNDVYKKDGETIRTPWPLWLKKCSQWGQFYDQLSDSCGACPDSNGQSPQEAFPDLNLPDESWFRQCMPMPSATGMMCACSYEYHGFDDNGNYNWGSGTQKVPMTESCKAADDGCMQFVSSREAWSVQPWMLKLPSYTCTGLPPFAPSSDVSSSMMTPPLEKDSLYQLLRFSFADGVDSISNITKSWQLKENSVKILFMSRISKSGQDLSVGPSLAELASNCQININVYFDTQGTAVNNGESVPASAIPTYSPLCVADEVNHMKEFIANITGEMAALANNRVTCNASKGDASGGHGYRRLSKRQKEVEKLLQSWEDMARSQGRPTPSMLGKLQLKKEAERMVAARQAREWKRKLQDETEHYVVSGRVRFWMQEDCESMGAAVGELKPETIASFYLPLLEHALGADVVSQYADHFKIEVNDCKPFELADGTTSGSSIFVQYTLDAGPVQGGDDSLQTAWYNAMLSAGSDASLYTSAVTDPIMANFKDTTGVTVTSLIIPDVNDASSMFSGGEVAWSVEATTMSFQQGACEQHCFEKSCQDMSCEEKYKCMDCGSDAMCSSPSTEGCDGNSGTGGCEQHCFEKSCQDMSCEEKYKCMDCGSDAMCSSPSKEGCESDGGTGTGGDGGTATNTENYGHRGDDDERWELKEGMRCEQKRQIIEERSQRLLQHAFVITGKDSWAGCKGFLDSWVVYGSQTKTKTTNKCTVPYEDITGAVNPAWEKDPCCNWVKRQEQCCGPRSVEEKITVVDDVNESNIALFSAATDSGTLALDLAMTYASTETEAAKSCFGPYKDFMDATSDVWKVVDECRTAVEGAWSETFQVQLGTKCTSDIDCYTGECYIPVSNKGGSSGSSGGQKQKYCKTPDEMEVPNWGAATLTCLIDKSIPELKGRLAIRLKMAGSSTPAELASRFLAEPGMQRSECRGHDNPWNRHTEEECMAPKQCNFDRAISNETQCLNPCQDGDVGCPSYCGQGDWEVSELPFCMPRVQDGADPWSACHSYVNEKRQEWELECQQCNEQCYNIDWSDPEHEPCNCHEVDGPCDYWRREEGAQRECMDDYCGRYCSGGECASLYRWQCIYAGFSFVSSRKEECLSECSAAGGPNPIPPKNCRAVLNPSTATEDACWKLGQGWIELHYADIPNWDWGRGPPPPESCVIKSYEVLDGKPYVPPPPYGPTCLPECESELDSCIENPNCHNYLEAEGKPVFQICEERFELFRESFESCLEQKRNGCSGVGCMRIYRACRISTGLEVDHIFKDVGCAGCDGWWSNRASRELQCAEELSVEQCRWNVLTQSTESQACARECVWEVCDQAFSECQIAGGSLSECNDLTIAMNQCRECNFIHCEDGCSKGACDVIFGSRDEAYRSCAGCDTSAQCNPSSPCYGDSADSSCNWRWAPEFGYSCSILCEESLRMCQEGVRGFCWEPDDTGVSRSDACHMEYDMYRADMDACWQANFPATLPEGAIWREIEIETTMTCAAQHLPQNWDCLKCDGEWNSWVVWSADLGPKCIAGTVSFDNGKTVPDTCSNCKPRTCPQYPVNCDARWYDERQCHWNEYNFKICSKSGAEAKATVVAANAECADCQTARCEWSCYDHTCSELMVIMPWDRMAPVEQCSGCPDVARCHPGAECFISDVVAYTQDDLNDWEQFLTLFQPMMDQYVACTGMSLQRRLKEDEAKTPKVQPTKPRKSMATKAERTPQVLKDLENKVTALWRQGNRLRNEGRNKRYQLKQLAEQNVGRTNFQGVIARRNLLEKQHQELQKRYLTLVQNHGEALKKWQNEGGVVTAPPLHPMSSFTEELRTIGSSESRRLQDMPQQVQLACTGSDCATQSGLCDAFFNRGGVAQQLVDTLVSSFSYDLLPWESGDKICQQMAEICYMSLDAAETAIVQGVYDNTFTPPWVDQWCDGWADMANCDASTQCSSCSDLTSAVDYNTCEGCCQCLDDVIGYYARLKHSWSIPEAKCRMLGEYLRKTGKDAWIHYDEKLLGGEGACSMHVDVWQLIPEVCHDPECYQSEECSKQCFRPEATKEMCPSPFTWSFFKSTHEWRPSMLATQSTCEVESCYPQPWIPTEAECKTVSHCESDCPYCETDQFWDWEMKKTMVKCSFVNSKTSKPLSEADCKIACGGSFSGTCYFKKDNRSTAAACITDPPTDALGSTTYEKCVGQKALTGASVTSANYELLQCSSFTTEQCGWAQTTFGQDMACTIHRLQCKNRADCKEAGRCDYEWDDWQIQENGGLCVAPNDFSKDTSYSPHRDFWGECSTLGGEHRSYGCMLYQVTSKDACTQAGAKWFPSAHSKSKCEVPGYAWKKMSSGGFYSGTMACCIQLRGSKSEGRCEMFTQDENSTSCEHCGGTWMSIFRFRSHGRWVEGSWQKNYKWTARAFEPSNKWVTRIAFEKVTDVWQNLIAAIRAVPAVNFVTCRIGPTLDTLVAIAKQTAAQSTLGTVPLLPATASATQVGDYVIEPSDNSVTGTTEIDVQVNLLSSGAVVAENAKGNSTNTTGGNRRMRRKRRLAGIGLSDTLTASCYTVVVNAGRYIGQLVGDCIIFSPSTALDNPVKVCLPTNPQIPVYGAFNLDCLVTVSSGVYSVAPMTVTKSTDGLSTCAQLSAPGTYCPGKIFGTGEPDRSAPSGCGSVTAISDTVVTQAAVLKAAGPVSLPGLVKIGETVSSDGFAPQAVYISSSGTVQSVEDFAETAQQITGTNAGGASTTVATTTVATTAGSSTTDESAETTEGEGTTSLDGRESSSTIKLSSNSCLPASMAVAAALLQLVM